MVKLGAYLLGEFGHECQDIPASKQFSMLKKHYDRQECKECRAGLILAFAKLLNANPESGFTNQILAVFEELIDSPNIELQQRACEFLTLHKHPTFSEAALTMMPVYSSGRDNPLIRRLKLQNKSRATTRHMLEESAKSEGGNLKKAIEPGKSQLSPKSLEARSGQSSPELSSAIVLAGANPPAAAANPPVLNAPEDKGSPSLALVLSPQSGAALARLPPPSVPNNLPKGSSDDSDDGSEDSDGSSGSSDAFPSPRVLWQQLCLALQGSFYLSDNLCLQLKHEYKQEQGRIAIYFINKSTDGPVENLNIEIIHPPKSSVDDNSEFLAVQRIDTQVKRTLSEGESFTHYLTLQCLRPFLQPLKYVVTYMHDGENLTLPLTLPSILTKFCSPAVQTNTVQEFERGFQGLAAGEAVMQGQAKIAPGGQVQSVLKGCNFHVLEPYPNQQYLGVSTLATKGNAGLGIMVKLEMIQNRAKISARAQHPAVAQSVAHMLASYIIEAGK